MSRKRRVNRCFWCDVEMTRPLQQHGPGYRLRRYDQTIEHIIPQSQIWRYQEIFDIRMRVLNKVFACNFCNNLRGSMDPIEWAAQYRPASMRRLALLLIDMKFPKEVVTATFLRENPSFTLESLT